jgi:hypothetical protein
MSTLEKDDWLRDHTGQHPALSSPWIQAVGKRCYMVASGGMHFVAVPTDRRPSTEPTHAPYIARLVRARRKGVPAELDAFRKWLGKPPQELPRDSTRRDTVVVLGQCFNRCLLAYALKDFDACPITVDADLESQLVRVRGDGWVAVVMALRDDPDNFKKRWPVQN